MPAERDLVRGPRLDHANLAGIRAISADFERVSCHRADLTSAQLSTRCARAGASFDLSDFTGADLSDADLSGTHMPDTVWVGAQLRGVVREGLRAGRDVHGGRALDGTTMGAPSERGGLHPDDLRTTRFANTCSTSRVVRPHAQLAGVNSARRPCATSTTEADLTRALLDLCHAHQGSCKATLAGLFARKAILQGADFGEARMLDCDLRGSDRGAQFGGALLLRAQLGLTRLQAAQFTGTDARGPCSITPTRATRSSTARSSASGFVQADLRQASFIARSATAGRRRG
ncbi:MAG: pentapeptide repeat-containing protein [Polyangiales bacterium]